MTGGENVEHNRALDQPHTPTEYFVRDLTRLCRFAATQWGDDGALDSVPYFLLLGLRRVLDADTGPRLDCVQLSTFVEQLMRDIGCCPYCESFDCQAPNAHRQN